VPAGHHARRLAEDFQHCRRAGKRDAHRVRFHPHDRPGAADLQGGNRLGIADEGIGDAQGHRVERPGDRDPQVLLAKTTEVLKRREQPRRLDQEMTRHEDALSAASACRRSNSSVPIG
jgi:hypothetical protein